MEGGTAKINIDHLVYLGFNTNIQARKWYDLFKNNTVSKCLGCGNKIRVTDPISKNLNMRYFTHRHFPEVHWIFNFKLNPNDTEAVEQCKTYVNTLSNKQKKEHLFSCCYKCWHIATNINKDYNTDSVNQYYIQYKVENPEYINWNLIKIEYCQNETQRQNKIMQYYEYIKDWCSMVNICSYTENGVKYCSKVIGKCIHTNPNHNFNINSNEPIGKSFKILQPSIINSNSMDLS